MQQHLVFPKSKFEDFFALMAAHGEVCAPVAVSEQSFAYKPVSSPQEIAFEALRTILPPKKYFYPPRETVITYGSDGIKENLPELKPLVLFGVHPCDLAGLGILDTIFSAGPADTHYLRRRQNTIIIGLSCMPDKHCFCKSMGTDAPDSGYDLFLTDLGQDYLIQAKTPLGFSLLEPVPSFMSPAQENHRQEFKDFWARRDKAFTTGCETANLSAVMDMEWDNPLWEELGNRCLSCGNCTPVCPTCYCFDLVDIASLKEGEGERQREWDSCQFSGFAQVNGGFNFRPNPVDRLKFWYRHKLHGFDDPYGFKTCVGCGRCTVSCPAGIDDLVGVVLKLQSQRERNAES